MDVLKLILNDLFLILSCIGTGSIVLKRLGFFSRASYFAFCFLVGEVVLASAWILFSFFLASPYNLFFIVPFLVLAFVYSLSLLSKDLYIRVNFSLNIVWWIVLLLILLFYLAHSFTQPTEWDVISYRLPVVEEISLGKISFPLLSSSPYVNFFRPFVYLFGNLPYSSESFAAIAYSLSGGDFRSVHIIYLANFVFFLILTGSFLVSFYRVDEMTILLVSILLSLDIGLFLVLSTGLMDVNAMVYQFATLYVALLVRKDARFVYLFVCLMSFALGQKYTSLFVVFPSVLYVIFVYFRDKNFKNYVDKSLLAFLTKSFLVFTFSGGFWYLKNFVFYKNPFYPLYLGHMGMSDELYGVLMDNLIYGLRSKNNFSDFIGLLKSSYGNDIGLVLVSVVVVASIIFGKIKLSGVNLFIIFNVLLIYFINFFFGSQLSRFILIVPSLVYILSSQVFLKNRVLGVFIVVFALMSVRLNSLQWSHWASRLENLRMLVAGKHVDIERKSLGCLYDIADKLKRENSVAFNLWDPYASSYYLEDNLFVDFTDNSDIYLNYHRPVSYLYVNEQYKLSFLENPWIHRDINLDMRVEFEKNTTNVAKLVFTEGNCKLYLIR